MVPRSWYQDLWGNRSLGDGGTALSAARNRYPFFTVRTPQASLVGEQIHICRMLSVHGKDYLKCLQMGAGVFVGPTKPHIAFILGRTNSYFDDCSFVFRVFRFWDRKIWQAGPGPDFGRAWARFGPGLCQIWATFGPGLGWDGPVSGDVSSVICMGGLQTAT